MDTQTTQQDFHFVARTHTLFVGKDGSGRPVAYRRGDVLPESVGRELFQAGEAPEDLAVEIRPGHAEPSDPHHPSSQLAVVRLPADQRMTDEERAEFAKVAAKAGAEAAEAALLKMAQHERTMDETGAQAERTREQVDAASKDKARRRRNKHKG